MVIFHSYVKLPEGIYIYIYIITGELQFHGNVTGISWEYSGRYAGNCGITKWAMHDIAFWCRFISSLSWFSSPDIRLYSTSANPSSPCCPPLWAFIPSISALENRVATCWKNPAAWCSSVVFLQSHQDSHHLRWSQFSMGNWYPLDWLFM